MAIPVIDPTQSIPDFPQWQQWGITLGCDNDPTSWSAVRLPPGVAINSANGLISGAATRPGVYSFDVTANNASGPSAPVRFTVGIRPAAPPLTVGAIDTVWNLDDNSISFPGYDARTGPIVKRNDDVYFHIRCTRAGAAVDLPAQMLKFAFTPGDRDAVPLLTSNAWLKVGSGDASVYLLYVRITVPDADLETNAEAPKELDADALIADPASGIPSESLFMDGLGEFEMAVTRAWALGAATPRASTRTFPMRVVRDLILNA